MNLKKIPRLSGCCLCLTTRNGTLLLAGLNILGGLLLLLRNIVLLATGDEADVVKEENNLEDVPTNKLSVFATLTSTTAYSLISLTLGILVFVGIKKEHEDFLVPYLIYSGVDDTVTALVAAVGFLLGPVFYGFWVSLTVSFGLMLVVACRVYFWLVVYSEYCYIKDANGSGRNGEGVV